MNRPVVVFTTTNHDSLINKFVTVLFITYFQDAQGEGKRDIVTKVHAKREHIASFSVCVTSKGKSSAIPDFTLLFPHCPTAI
jgi:hypothetical protein